MGRSGRSIEDLLEPVVTGMGYELVGVDYRGGGQNARLLIYIDRPEGITVDDCAKVSGQVSAVLDVEDPVPGEYVLEVSSPGLDRPLFNAGHFRQFAGHEVTVRMRRKQDGQKNFRGVIKGVEDDRVVIDHEGRAVTLLLDDMDRANLIPDFEQVKPK